MKINKGIPIDDVKVDPSSRLSAEEIEQSKTAHGKMKTLLRRKHVRKQIPQLIEHSEDPLDLLTEWYLQWEQRDDMPAKMDDSLHIRTMMVLLGHGRIDRN